MRVSILRKRAGDVTFMRALGERAFGEYDPRAGDHTVALSERRGALTLVAHRGDHAVGFAIINVRGTTGSLEAIAVDETQRGTGLGRRLLREAEACVVRSGATEFELVTAVANLAALDLFLGAGFRIEQRLSRYYRRGQDAVRLIKRW